MHQMYSGPDRYVTKYFKNYAISSITELHAIHPADAVLRQ